MSPTSNVPILLSNSTLTNLVLNSIKVDLVGDFAGAMMRYQLSRQVADIILSMTTEEIQLIAELSTSQNILRLANCNVPSYWADMKKAVSKKDRTAVSLSLVQSILAGVPQALPA